MSEYADFSRPLHICSPRLFPDFTLYIFCHAAAAAAAKSLQSRPTLCDPIDSSPPGSTVPGILQARTLEWVAISFSNAWKWKVKGKSLSLDPMDCSPPGKSTGVGCHCLLQSFAILMCKCFKFYVGKYLYIFFFWMWILCCAQKAVLPPMFVYHFNHSQCLSAVVSKWEAGH